MPASNLPGNGRPLYPFWKICQQDSSFWKEIFRKAARREGKNGGESGIRTRGTPLRGVQSLSRRSLSATQPSLRDLFYDHLSRGHLAARCPLRSGRYLWRREQDSNPRTFRSTVFKTAAIDHSAIPPHIVHAIPRREFCQSPPCKAGAPRG